MKKNYKNKFLGISLVTAMLLGSSAYAGKIIGVTAGTSWEEDVTNPPAQYGFGGWNLDNVNVKIVSIDDFSTSLPGTYFDELTGEYSDITYGDSFESEISTGGQIRGLLHGKNWPVGEPAGIKVVNDDTGTEKSGKSPNCIMTTSYLDEVDTGTGVSGYLDILNEGGTPVPTVCSSPFQSHKRFKVNMMPTTVNVIDTERYGKPIDLVFNLDTQDNSPEFRRYQVFSKINNYTGMRLDGYKVELLDENQIKVTPSNQIKFSLDLTTKTTTDDESGYAAVFAHGLWGPKDKHFPENGFFDEVRAGFVQEGDNLQELTGGTTTLGSNYVDLFGIWLPSKWAPYGIFFDDDNDPTTDAELIAFWGTVPNAAPGTLPAWHYGKDYDLKDGDQSWAEPTVEEWLTWMTDPLYSLGKIEDTLNLGLNYVVEVGLNSTIGKTFTIRITPHVAPATAQTAPNYIDAGGNYIMPPTGYNSSVGSIVINPSPTFVPGATLTIAVGDKDLNTDAGTVENLTVIVKNSTGDEENVLLVETDTNSSIFTGTLPTDSINVGGVNDGTMTATIGTLVTAYYMDESENATITASTTASTSTTTTVLSDDDNPSSGGGGCTYNPNSKSFDMAFLLMMVLGLLYPFRRRFIK